MAEHLTCIVSTELLDLVKESIMIIIFVADEDAGLRVSSSNNHTLDKTL